MVTAEWITFLSSRDRNWMNFAPRPCYIELKIKIAENMKLFSIRVKKSFDAIVLPKMATSFALFESIFLRNRFPVRYFYGKEQKI